MLEALAAVNRTPLSRLEGDRGLLPTLRTNRLGFNSLNACRTVPVALGARGFARLATLRLVFEAFVGEKHLLAGGEDEFRTAVGTLQDPIMVFHTLLRTRTGRGPAACPPGNTRDVSRLEIHLDLCRRFVGFAMPGGTPSDTVA